MTIISKLMSAGGTFSKIRKQTPTVKILALVSLLSSATRYPVWIVLTLLLSSVYHTPFLIIGVIFFLSSAISFPFNILAGRIMDRIGRRTLSLIIPILISITYFLLFYTAYRELQLIYIIIETVASTTLLSVQNVLINAITTDMSIDQERLSAFSLIRVAANAGVGIGLVIAGVMSLISPYVFFIVPVIASMVEFYIFYRFVPESLNRVLEKLNTIKKKFTVHRDRLLVAVSIFMAISMLFADQFEMPTLPLYLETYRHITEFYITLIYGVNALVVILLQFRLNSIGERFGYIKSFSVGMLLYAFSFLGFAATGNLVLLAGNTAMLTVGECLCNPFLSVTISRISPANKRGEYFGFSSSLIGTIFPLGPLVGTIFLTYLFNPQILMWALFFAINASLAIISLVARKSIKSRERQLGNLSHS